MTHPKVLAMARECAAKYWQTGEPSDEHAARMIMSGEWDDQAYTQAAIAAIERVTELADELACHGSAKVPSQNDFTRGYADARGNLACALRRFDHLPEPEGGSE